MTAKEQLQELRRLDDRINRKIKELEELRQRSVGVGGFDYSKDRVMSSPSGDAMPNVVSKITSLEDQINGMIDVLVDAKEEACCMISGLDDKKEQNVLFWRYIKGKNWKQVSNEMGISRRHTHRLHGRALYHLDTMYSG